MFILKEFIIISKMYSHNSDFPPKFLYLQHQLAYVFFCMFITSNLKMKLIFTSKLCFYRFILSNFDFDLKISITKDIPEPVGCSQNIKDEGILLFIQKNSLHREASPLRAW